MASKIDIGEMLAQLHGAVQPQPDPDDDSQPTDRQSANSGGPGALAAFSFAIDSDEDRTGQPTLYQSEKDGLTSRPPADRHAFKEYRRGQFNNNRNFDFSQLPPGAITKDSVQKLVGGGAVSATQFANAKAFLDTIAFSEGTSVIGFNANKGAGYDVQVGGGIIGDLSWHPGQVILLNRDTGLASSAAGRYQFLGKTWEECAHKLGLKNFQASSQDIAALYLLQHAVDRKTGMTAFDYMMQGNFKDAIHTARGVWASFPGAGYGQHENAMERLEQFYRHAGGHMAGDPEIQEANANPTPDDKLTATPAAFNPAPRGNQFDIAIGDSIAVAANLAGVPTRNNSAVQGRSPQEILDYINSLPPGALKGQRVLLSTGLSNNTAQFALVSEELKALRDKGATSITILGVGPRSDYQYHNINPRLADLVKGNPDVAFAGPLQNTRSDDVHPVDENASREMVSHALSVAPNPAQQERPVQSAEADQRGQRNQARNILAQHAPEIPPEQIAANQPKPDGQPDRRRDGLNVAIADTGKKPSETPSSGPKSVPGTNKTALLG